MNQFKKGLLTVLATLAATGVFVCAKIPVHAISENIPYIDENGVSCVKDITVEWSESEFNPETMDNNWYFISGNVSTSNPIKVRGDVHVILADGKQLSANKGIHLEEGANLTIYAQTLNTDNAGKIYAEAKEEGIAGAAIGSVSGYKCGKITINGGVITALSEADAGGTFGIGAAIGAGVGGAFDEIEINNGLVLANVEKNRGDFILSGKDNQGAGIGAAMNSPKKSGNITINGGIVYAKSSYGAAIGGGDAGECGNITINGGEVHATSYVSQRGAAAIGTGRDSTCGDIIINGGIVDALVDGTEDARYDYNNVGAIIGTGKDGTCGSILINGGQVSAKMESGLSAEVLGIGAYNNRYGKGAQIVIGYSKEDDYVEACSYDTNIATIKAGCSFKKASDGTLISSLEDAKGVRIIPATATFEQHSISLGGTIGINYYMQLPGNVDDYANSYMTFSINEGGTYARVPAQAAFDANNKYVDDVTGKTYYRFTCYVQVPELADDVVATFHNGESTITDTYSVKKYIDDYISSKGNVEEAVKTAEGELVLSLGDYAYFTQQLLKSTKKWGDSDHVLLSSYYWHDSLVMSNAEAQTNKYAMTRTLDAGISKANMSVITDEDTAIKFTIVPAKGKTIDADSVVVKKGSTTLTDGYEVTTSGSNLEIRIGGIKAQDLDEAYDVTVSTTDGDKATITGASVMSYVNAVFKSSGANETFKNAAGSLYFYNDYANEYVASH